MGIWNDRLKPGFKNMWDSFSVYESPKYVLVKDASLVLYLVIYIS